MDGRQLSGRYGSRMEGVQGPAQGPGSAQGAKWLVQYFTTNSLIPYLGQGTSQTVTSDSYPTKSKLEPARTRAGLPGRWPPARQFIWIHPAGIRAAVGDGLIGGSSELGRYLGYLVAGRLAVGVHPVAFVELDWSYGS